MLMPITVLFVMIVALLRGGSLRNFSSLRLRWIPLAIGSFLLQLLIFTPFRETPLVTISTTQIYMLSMALLTLWVAANWRIPGMALMAAGLLANFVAIAANGGYMPVSPAHARIAGTIDRYATEGQAIANNSLATEDDVRLWLLTDILPLPQGFPFANVYSIGDVLLTIGAAILCYRTIRRPRASAPPPAELQGGAAPRSRPHRSANCGRAARPDRDGHHVRSARTRHSSRRIALGTGRPNRPATHHYCPTTHSSVRGEVDPARSQV